MSLLSHFFHLKSVEYGHYWDHYEQFHLLAKVCSHFKVIKYEEMKKDLKAVLQELCTFLNKPLSEEKLQQLIRHLSFDNMKKNPANNYEDTQMRMRFVKPEHEFKMIRKGQVGAFKEEMSKEMIKAFNEKTDDVLKRLNHE